MLKARRKEQVEELRFPEPRQGLPEDPRPFLGSQHLVASAAVQEHLSARCLVAVVGRVGAGKSTVCRRAANSRWARQWFLHDEGGQPLHRRFWVDLEDALPGADAEQHVAHALGRSNFDEALARLGSGKPCLLILDNADQAFSEEDHGDTLARLVACVERGASIIMTRRSIAGLDVGRPWSDVVEVSGFVSHNEARELFDKLAPRHASDLRVADVVAACDRLPLAVTLLGRVVAGADLEAARVRVGPDTEGRGLDFSVEVAAAMLDPQDRQLWGALSLLPAGLAGDDIADVFAAAPDARERAIKLFDAGVAHRCEAGVRIPAPLRLSGTAANLHDIAVSDLWRGYLRRARAVVGPVPDWATVPGGRTGTSSSTMASPRPEDRADRADRPGRAVRPDLAPRPGRANTSTPSAWLARQVPNLRRLAAQPTLPDGTFDLGCASLLAHRSGLVADAVDQVLVRLIDANMSPPAVPEQPDQPTDALPQGTAHTDLAARIAAELEEQRRFGTSVLVAAAVAGGHRRAGRTKGEAEALCQMGRCERFLGHYQDAEVHLTEARQHFEKLDDGVGKGSALFELGQVDLDLGRLDDAETHLGEALSLFAAHGRPVGEANANLELVRLDLARGRPDKAERRLGDALDRYEEAGDRLGFANACLQLGQVELARGHLDGAERHFGGAMDGYEQAEDRVGFANACLQLGQVDLARGHLDAAERRFGGALAGYVQVGDKVGVANASLQMGQIDLAQGRPEHAAQRLHQALAAYEHLGDRIGLANASLLLGQVHLGQGELDEADQQFCAAQAAYDEIGDRMGSANSRHLEAMLREAQGRGSQAMALFGDAGRLYTSLGRTTSAALSLAGAARTCTGRAERRGYAADAVRLLEEAGMAEAASQLAAELAERPPEPQPAPPSTPEAPAAVLDLTWDPKWNRELVAVARGDSSADDGESDDTWSAPLPSDRDAVEAASVGEWTSRWQVATGAAAGATTGAATEAAAETAADADAAVSAEAAGPGTRRVDRPTSGDSATGPGSLLGGWTPSAWAHDPAPSADLNQTSAPLHWPEPPDEAPTEHLGMPPGGLRHLEAEAAAAPSDVEQTLFGDIVAPRKTRRRWGRRKDE
ncbi:MAG: hypothetical protein QOF81_334 [Acidimicrobiaceae bacterium]|nr:hypothetical protein [Acidimicrobiaceae bacterium]